MESYLKLLEKVLNQGTPSIDRTGVGTLSLFGEQVKYDLTKGFPLVTTKKIYTDSVVHELIWMLRGVSNIQYLRDNKVSIWEPWATKEGDLGPMYPTLWRNWPLTRSRVVDQIQNAIDLIKQDPYSRRIVVSAWNPQFIPLPNVKPHLNVGLGKAALCSCHCLFQFYVRDNKLSCQLYQRSGDVFLGTPFNIASYALLTHLIAQVCGLGVGDFIHTYGDVHLYSNHVDQAILQLKRDPLPLPRLVLNPDVDDINNFTFEDITFEGYTHHSAIRAPIAV